MAGTKTLAEVEQTRSSDPANAENPFGRGNLYSPADVANLQVLIAKEGDRIPRMLSAARPIMDQLQDMAREHGEKHVTVNGQTYAELAGDHELERRGDTSLPFAAGMTGVVQQHDPDLKLEQNREAGIHNPENYSGEIVPVADSDPTRALADEARRRKEENATLQQALEADERRRAAENESSRHDEIESQFTKQVSEQSGEGTSSGGNAPDNRDIADRAEQKSDAELEEVALAAEARGDHAAAAEARAMQGKTNPERVANGPIVDAASEVRVASRDPNKLANDPPTTDPVERRDVEQMSKADLKAELEEYGTGYDSKANHDLLAQLVTEERAKRLPK